jgi:hypothetical protein
MTLAASGFIGLTIVFGVLLVLGVAATLMLFWGGVYAAVRVARKAWADDTDE